MNLAESENTPFNKELLLKNKKEIVKVLKKHTIFEFIKENKRVS
jgi:hypothetical protein